MLRVWYKYFVQSMFNQRELLEKVFVAFLDKELFYNVSFTLFLNGSSDVENLTLEIMSKVRVFLIG